MDYINNFKLDISFWTGFYEDDCNDSYDCISWASNKAYLDMNRTMTFSDVPQNDTQGEMHRIDEQRKVWRDNGTKHIRKGIMENTDDFKVWHRDVCRKLIGIYGSDKLVQRVKNKRSEQKVKLTYGQAQKWLNMTLKYLWLLNRLKLITDENTSAFIQKHEKLFHVPLDSYILRYVAKIDKNKKDKFRLSNENGLDMSIDFSRFWQMFGSAWSQIDDENEYYKYQEELAKSIKKISPLEWELVHWHKAIRFYG